MIKNLPYELRDLEINVQKMLVRLNQLEAAVKAGSVSPEEFYAFKAEVEAQLSNLSNEITKFSVRYIVAKYSSGNDWYEVYNDGWVRQGQINYDSGTTASIKTLSLLISMRTGQYLAIRSPNMNNTQSPSNRTASLFNRTTTTFSTYTNSDNRYFDWTVEGWGDSATVTALGASPEY